MYLLQRAADSADHPGQAHVIVGIMQKACRLKPFA